MNVCGKSVRQGRAGKVMYGAVWLLSGALLLCATPALALTVDSDWENAKQVGAGSDSNVGDISGGNVTVNSGAGAGFVVGGVTNTGNADHNTVIFNNGTARGRVYGGQTFRGNSTHNTVTVNAGWIEREVYGGLAEDGKVYKNDVIINAGTLNIGVYGGFTSRGAEVTENTVLVVDGVMHKAVGGAIFNNASPGVVQGNEVTIRGGAVGTVIGGESPVGTVKLIENVVSVYDGTVAEVFAATVGSSYDTSEATGNVVNYYGGDITGVLVGGNTKTSKDNVLNMYVAGKTLRTLDKFQQYNFYLPETLAADATVLTVTSGNITGDALDLSDTTVHVGVSGSASPLKGGDTIVLIKADNGITGSPLNTETSGEGMQGITTLLTFDLTTTEDSLIATVTGASGNPQLKSFSESRIAGIGMLTMGGDMIAGQALSQLRAAAPAHAGLVPFGVMGGSSMRYKSGSHVDVDGFNLVTGLGWNTPLNAGSNLLTGVFFEAGWGDYDAHNSFNSVAAVKGKGNTNYYGGGLLARYDAPATDSGNIYAETSLRMGRVKTDYDSRDFETASGRRANFDSSATYYGAHAGVGYLWNISDATTLDTYAKYFWTRQDSDSVNVEGARVKFKAMNSHRARVGAKIAHTMKNTKNDIVFTPYAGAAFERELDGKARGTAAGYAIDAPSVRGNTGIGELGFNFKPSATSGFSVDLGMQGYTGKREGIGGSLQVKWEF